MNDRDRLAERRRLKRLGATRELQEFDDRTAPAPAPATPRRAPAAEPAPAPVPTPPEPRTREKAPERPGEVPEKAKPDPAPVVDPTAALNAALAELPACLTLRIVTSDTTPDGGIELAGRNGADPDEVTAALEAFRPAWGAAFSPLVEGPPSAETWGSAVEAVREVLPKPVKMTRHKTQIAPRGLLSKAPVSYVEYETLELPLGDKRLVTLGYQDPPAQLALFGEDPETEIPLPLELANAAGFSTLKPGPGARLDKRLFLDALSAPPMSNRHPGGRYEWEPTVEEMTADHWLRWRPGENGRHLVEALVAIHNARIRRPDGRRFAPVVVREEPNPWDRKSRAVFEILYPDDVSVGGPRYNRPALLAAGRVSDPAYDLELSLAWHFDALRHPDRKAAPPVFDREDRRRLAYGPRSPETKQRRNKQRHMADKLLEAIEAAGRIRIERLAAGWRLLEPLPEPVKALAS